MRDYQKMWLCTCVIILACISVCDGADAQSLSDIQWQAFQTLNPNQNVIAHTDPFSSGHVSSHDLAIEELQIAGIIYGDENEAYALISGYLLKAGDHIAGYRVDMIESDKVMLRRIDEVFILSLEGGL